ncbi:lactococcin 972 family bacteriocin [Spongiactinospora rosea]|uniref:Lactococcin 972 family bacteriocin n=1 Tax=Spongiactinospora rosea TaxID=2248750 RepID=A0A366LKY1_9ACTN|nr:lactococcin 972 family bacteriocin [Spongiactinospora rosea]RBQ14143.1 lactococcin 972 family bacteriocin [Spongiactinospora rosea]
MEAFRLILLMGTGVAAASAIFAVGAGAAVAEPAPAPTSGSALLDSQADARTLEIEQVGGGTWSYGVNSRDAWSNYYHGALCHGSSVQGTIYMRDWNVAAGYWSEAIAPSKPVGNKAYWRNTC